jgi:DHA1 family bicyclomycin/chloramphenicol resistance-like MFS transporter
MYRPINPASALFLVLLALFAGLPALATDMALSATLAISQSIAAAPGDIGLTLTAFMIGFAASPLVYGPLADRLGRKPIILCATGIFAIGGVGCAISVNLAGLLTWRLVQGLGAGASSALSATIICDRFEGPAARAKMSYISMMRLVAPLSAPTIGSLLLHIHDWRLIYWVLAITGAVVCFAMWIGLEESFTPDDRNKLTFRQIANNYLAVLGSLNSVRFIGIASLSFACLFSYVSGSPLIMMGLYKLSPSEYGLTFAITACGIFFGSFTNGRLNARRIPPYVPLSAGLAAISAATLILLISCLRSLPPLPIFLSLVALCTFSVGLIISNAQQLALEPLPRIAGVASAVIFSCQLGFGGLAGGLVSALHDGRSPSSTTISMALCACLACALYFGTRNKVNRLAPNASPQTPN